MSVQLPEGFQVIAPAVSSRAPIVGLMATITPSTMYIRGTEVEQVVKERWQFASNGQDFVMWPDAGGRVFSLNKHKVKPQAQCSGVNQHLPKGKFVAERWGENGWFFKCVEPLAAED